MEDETKVSIAVALVLVLTALYDLRLAAGLATIYLVIYGVRRLRKERTG